MEFRTICFLIVAVAIVVAEANTVSLTAPDLTTSDVTGSATANLRSKRQFYPGYGGGFSGSSATAGASSGSFGGGPFGGGFSGSQAQAGASSFGTGFGK